jgi:neutral ceramidase
MKLLPVCLALLSLCLSARAGIKAGFTERDITPEIGMEVPGGYGKSFSKRIHDPCKARIALFDDGAKRVVLVGLDALVIPRQLVLEVRAQIQERCGIPGDAIMIAASHSHSSGPVGMVLKGEFDHASPLVQDLAYNKSSMADPRYLEKVRNAIVEGVVAADKARTDVTLAFGVGKEPTVAFNRRIRMKNGLSFSHPGKGNPESVEYAGPTDPEVGVIGVWTPEGQLAGCVVNFACHATTSGPWISANWPGYMEKVIQGYYGKSAPVVFLNGMSGDVTQVDNLDPTANPGSDDWAQLVGGRVGAEALKVLLGMSRTRINDVRLDARQKVLRIPRRHPSAERLQEARELIEKDPKDPDWVWAKETLMLDALIKSTPIVDAEVQAIQVGPVICLSTPAEYFCQFGLDMKAQSGHPITFPVELANGSAGYVPTMEAFGPHGGGYETRLSSYSNLEISAGNQMRDAALELAWRMTPVPLPTPPLAPPSPKPWAYGNLPPQLQ